MCNTNNLIYVRVLQQDTEDQIRMGRTYPILKENLDEHSRLLKKFIDYRLEWCGGFEKGCNKYYTRIALVDAVTFASVREIWTRNR